MRHWLSLPRNCVFLMIKIIAVGKKHDTDLTHAISSYQKRLKVPFDVDWVFLPNSPRTLEQARQSESEAIMKRLLPDNFVILLDERGDLLTSELFSGELQNQNIVVIIGGAYGVTDELRRRADSVVSLSKMVFPHQLVRLVLIEQIYRAQTIISGHPYHHT